MQKRYPFRMPASERSQRPAAISRAASRAPEIVPGPRRIRRIGLALAALAAASVASAAFHAAHVLF